MKVVVYTDDIAVLIVGTDYGNVQARAGNFLRALVGWPG